MAAFGLDFNTLTDGVMGGIKGVQAAMGDYAPGPRETPQYRPAARQDPFAELSYGDSPLQAFRRDSPAPLAGYQRAREDPFAGLQYGGDPLAGYDKRSSPMGLSFGAVEERFAPFDMALGAFNAFQRGEDAKQKERERTQRGPLTPTGGAGGTGATGVDPGTDKWRDLIDKAAAEYGNAELGDVAQAIMMLESGGDPRATSHAGAMGLMQVMPFHFGDGEDGYDPYTNISRGLKVLMDGYRRWGTWEQAAAAYFGAIDGNGNITGASDGNATGNQYVAIFTNNWNKIKAARAAQRPQGGAPGVAGGMASIWGGVEAPVTQAYGVVTPGIDQSIYGYGRELGGPGGHTGLDIGLQRGAAIYMPAGLTGTVVTAGGTPYFLDEDYGDRGTPGKGELRVRLSNGDEIIFGHNSAINVGVGQQVTGGMQIASVGSANGPHLHLEVRVRQPDGSYRLVNPAEYFGYNGPIGRGDDH